LPQQPQLAYIFANPEDAGKSLFWDIGVGVKLEESGFQIMVEYAADA